MVVKRCVWPFLFKPTHEAVSNSSNFFSCLLAMPNWKNTVFAPQWRSWNTTHKAMWPRPRVTLTSVSHLLGELNLHQLITNPWGLLACGVKFARRGLHINVVWTGMRKPAARWWWFRVISVTRPSLGLTISVFMFSPSMAWGRPSIVHSVEFAFAQRSD